MSAAFGSSQLFDESRKLQAKQCAGLSLTEKEDLARQETRAAKDQAKAWLAEQRRAQTGWAKWCRLRELNPEVADRYRAAHTDDSGDWNWTLAFASLRSVEGVRIPSRDAFVERTGCLACTSPELAGRAWDRAAMCEHCTDGVEACASTCSDDEPGHDEVLLRSEPLEGE
jgi:hypothetical protein